MKKKKKAVKRVAEKTANKYKDTKKNILFHFYNLSAEEKKYLKREFKKMETLERKALSVWKLMDGFEKELNIEAVSMLNILQPQINKVLNSVDETMEEPYRSLLQKTYDFGLIQKKFFDAYKEHIKQWGEIKMEAYRKNKRLTAKKLSADGGEKALKNLKPFIAVLSESLSYKEEYNKVKEMFEKLKKDFSKLKPN